MELQDFTVQFAYSCDKINWGLQNNYEYKWDLDNPILHSIGMPERVASGIKTDGSFEPLIQINPTTHSGLICRDACERPNCSSDIWFQAQILSSDNVVHSVIDLLTNDLIYEYNGPIRKIIFTRLGLDCVILADQ